jgi:pSer/pThr/pTyr-binding forkhead associated (FHA) protein
MSAPKRYMRLEVISGNDLGNTITVEDELVIGRHADGPGRLAGDEEISRQHARISREVTGDYAIEDLGSSNGTFVNGLRINSPRLLSLGDSIETGATTLVVREIAVPPDAARPSASAPSPAAASPQAVAPSQAGTPPSAATPPLALSLEVDLDAREARVKLGDGGEAVRFVFADGSWRAVSS